MLARGFLGLLVASLSLAGGGCMMVHERYHIKATSAGSDRAATGDEEGEAEAKAPGTGTDNTNFYRVTITGWTLFATSQYSAGWFDEDAVDSLFGELKGRTVKVDSVDLEGFENRTPANTEKTKDNANEKPSAANILSFRGSACRFLRISDRHTTKG